MSVAALLDRPIAFHRPLVSVCGSITAALLLSQAIYWAKRCSTHEDGKQWFYKTQADWEEETGMSRREQESARKRLVGLGVLNEKKMGVPARLFYSVDFERLSGLLACPSKDGGKRQTRMAEIAKPVCTKAPNCDGGKRQTITENTTEIKNKTPLPPTGGIPPESAGKNQDPKPEQPAKQDYQAALEIYNDTVADRLPHAVELNDKRRRGIKRLIGQLARKDLEGFRAYVAAFVTNAPPFYFGDNDRGWTANLDYLLRADTLTKVREGTL